MEMSRNIRIALVIAIGISLLYLYSSACRYCFPLKLSDFVVAILPVAGVLSYWFIMGAKKKGSEEDAG